MSPLSRHLLEDGSLVTVSIVNGVTIVKISCPSVRQRQVVILEECLFEVADTSGGQLAVCLSGVAEFSSALINALIAVDRHCASMGGKLVIYGLTRQVRRLLRTTHLDKTLCIADSSEDALAAFDEATPRGFFARRKAG